MGAFYIFRLIVVDGVVVLLSLTCYVSHLLGVVETFGNKFIGKEGELLEQQGTFEFQL